MNLLINNTSYSDLQLNKIYITNINKDYKCDTFFVKLNEKFNLVKYSDKKYDTLDKVNYRFLTYELIRNYFDKSY